MAVLSMALREASAAKSLTAFALNPASPEPAVLEWTGTNPAPVTIVRDVSTVSRGLRTADGLAVDADSGDIYVSMEDAAAVVRIRPDGSRQVVIDGSTVLYLCDEAGNPRKRVSGLRSPEGLALDRNGMLYIVEDVPGGRLITFNTRDRTRRPVGKVVPVPIHNSRFAWESVAVGPAGELLLAGSTMESFLNDADQAGLLGVFWGAILYRDAEGIWWMPLQSSMTSYSAVGFSPDGRHAYFACEVPGDLGCLNLESRKLITYLAGTPLRSPEGLCVLPDGTALVAEEAGGLHRLDPFANTVQQVYAAERALESIHWDARNHRLLATDDRQGALLALELDSEVDFQGPPAPDRKIPFKEWFMAVELIPERCPAYLGRILKLGGYDPLLDSGELTFRDFARKYSLLAVDAKVEFLSQGDPVDDPIKRIQFVIVAPYMVGMIGGELFWSISGFAAIHESGAVVKTRLVTRDVIQGDLLECQFTPMGGRQIALPMPFSTKVDADGMVSVHFMGMGVMPDFLMMLNTVEPNSSYMLVMSPNARPALYGLALPANRNRYHWVIALDRKEPELWKRLSPSP